MNIESTHFISSVPALNTMEGSSSALTDTDIQSGFTQAFLEQMAQFNAENPQADLLKSIQSDTGDSMSSQLQNLVDLLGDGGDMQKLAAFFGKELPVSVKSAEAVDLEATLSSLAGTLSSAKSSEFGGESQNAQNLTQDMIQALKQMQTETQPDSAESLTNGDLQNLLNQYGLNAGTTPADATNKSFSIRKYQDNGAQEPDGDLVTALTLSALTPAITASGPTDSTIDFSGSLPEVPQTLTQGLKAASQISVLTASTTEKGQGLAASEIGFQKLNGESQSEQNKPVLNVSGFDKSELSDKTVQLVQDSTQGVEKNLIRAGAEMSHLNRPGTEIKAEVPALAKPMTHPEWNKDLGDRILWMNNRSIPAAEIKLNPQHLGPISVRIDISQDQAAVSFVAQHSSVREALEASIPKLREMLNSQQLNLVDVNVSQHSSSDQGHSQSQKFTQTSSNSGPDSRDTSIETSEDSENQQAITTKGLLSIYA